MAVPSELRLASEIAAQFRHQSPEEAAEAIAAHIRRFWDPRMRARLMNQVTQAGEDCDADVAAAVGLLEHAPHQSDGPSDRAEVDSAHPRGQR